VEHWRRKKIVTRALRNYTLIVNLLLSLVLLSELNLGSSKLPTVISYPEKL
jgi:hypothetical protein